MEQPRRPYQFGMPESLEGDAGAIAKHPEVPHAAGQIILHGESARKEDQHVDHVQRSAWHRISLNKMGHVVEQQYGQEFYKEQAKENGGVVPAHLLQQPGQVPQQTDAPTQPAAASVVPVPQVPENQFTASNPIYSIMTHPRPAAQPQPIDQPKSTQVEQPASLLEPAQPVQPQYAASQPHLNGAVNPSFAPQLPQMQEPLLPQGTPAPVDSQHLLPAATHHARNVLRSPWLWLALGLGMILYFGRSLFS
ncbi:MAG TPA: hypothetical protein VJ843_04990 [Candidatus Saccharimonadales bacterium]|nr:hypothetical protein [Candidatus Saccharimonadales bacterium]